MITGVSPTWIWRPSGHVVVGDELRLAGDVLEQVKPRAPGVDHHRVLLALVHLQDVARHALAVRAVALRAQAAERLGAQVLDFVARHGLRHFAEGLERACARKQEVAANQVRKAEVGVLGEQLLDPLDRQV
jgi:hypothetical protein